jgi:predicted nucleic acid-binding protein
MALRPSSSKQPHLLIADTSVIINIIATGCAEPILKALPHRLVIVDVVVDEIAGGVRKGRKDANELSTLIKAGLIEVVKLGAEALIVFESLVIGPASDTLDDGEAATIAYAKESRARALIEERKARRLVAERYPSLPLGCTIDLLRHIDVERAIGPAGIATTLHKALVGARMRVLDSHMDWVVNAIGDELAANCHSLPGATRAAARARHLRGPA